MTKINLVCVGLGNQFNNYHIRSINLYIKNVKSIKLYDINYEKSIKVRQEMIKFTNSIVPIKIYYSIDDLLKEPIIEEENVRNLCVVSTPVYSHYDIILQFLKKDYHIYVDKPFVSDEKQAISLIEESQKRGKIIIIGAQRRFETIYHKILSASKKLGSITLISFQNHGQFKLINNESIENDAFIGVGYHIIDTVVWLVENLRGNIIDFRLVGSLIQKWDKNPIYSGGVHSLLVLETETESIPVKISISNLAPRDTINEFFSITGNLGEIRLHRDAAPRNQMPGIVNYYYWNTETNRVVKETLNKDDEYDRCAPLKHIFEYLLSKEYFDLEATAIKSLNTIRILDSIKNQSIIMDT